MAENTQHYTDKQTFTPTTSIGQQIEDLAKSFKDQRRNFERVWYDNNYFDDGYHFRFVSRTTGKIIDQTDLQVSNVNMRAIPKASRQLRGIVNLLLGPTYVPVVYPDRVPKAMFPDVPNPENPEEMMPNPQYLEALEVSKLEAQRQGDWIQDQWHELHVWEKLMYMALLSGKNSVSYIQVWKHAYEEKICTEVYDAFDVLLDGNLTNIEDSPAVIKVTPQRMSKIKSNSLFNPEQVAQLHPDNKYASSELKQAYMESRYGLRNGQNVDPTLLLKESFMKTYLSNDNIEEIQNLGTEGLLQGKKIGDCVMRHTFSVAGIWLYDEFIDMKEYPFVDFRYEPGPLYQKCLIENFIPANKSLDIVMSNVEKWTNTMAKGSWSKRKGENFDITNANGQVVEYENTPPTQNQIAPLPNTIFNYIGALNGIIEEQGASTSALGVLPDGVKSGVAIESVKATEYANLKIPTDMFKDTVRRIAEKMLAIGAEFVEPQTVQTMDRGEPRYFDVMGEAGIVARQQIGEPIPSDIIPLKKDTKVRIEVESGLGFTMEGKKGTLQQIITFLTPFLDRGILGKDAMLVLIKKALETYQFGATQEFVDAINTEDLGSTTMNEEQLEQMKVAILEVLKDAGMVGDQKDQQLVDSTKVGMMEAMKDMGGSAM